jgi:hypothetical protein
VRSRHFVNWPLPAVPGVGTREQPAFYVKWTNRRCAKGPFRDEAGSIIIPAVILFSKSVSHFRGIHRVHQLSDLIVAHISTVQRIHGQNNADHKITNAARQRTPPAAKVRGELKPDRRPGVRRKLKRRAALWSYQLRGTEPADTARGKRGGQAPCSWSEIKKGSEAEQLLPMGRALPED